MSIKVIKETLIPALNGYLTNAIVIKGDGIGEKPDGPHATYKITTPYAKGVGQADETTIENGEVVQLKRSENYKATISFTAYAMDDEVSFQLAQDIHDWFNFYGADILNDAGAVVFETGNVGNRDAFIVENYERRNGFDVILRLARAITKDVDYIDSVGGISE